MKKFLLGTVGLIALGMASAPASAADLAARPYTKAPPMVQAMYDWSGFYIGINGGWAQDHDGRVNQTTLVNLGGYDANGGTVGGQLGYRWQSGAFVFGLEAQGNWADLTGSTQNLGNPANSLHSKLDAFGLFTGQVGYAWNNVLLYAKGGAAVTDRNYEFVTNATGLVGSSSGYTTQWSPTVGVGLEYGFAPNWSFGVEYNHIFEDRHTVGFTNAAGVPLASTYSSGGDTDMVLGRLNYKFGYGAPLLAKY
jgi:outer membrane immunogenic protein